MAFAAAVNVEEKLQKLHTKTSQKDIAKLQIYQLNLANYGQIRIRGIRPAVPWPNSHSCLQKRVGTLEANFLEATGLQFLVQSWYPVNPRVLINHIQIGMEGTNPVLSSRTAVDLL